MSISIDSEHTIRIQYGPSVKRQNNASMNQKRTKSIEMRPKLYTPKSNNNVETTTELNLTFVDDKELSENKQ